MQEILTVENNLKNQNLVFEFLNSNKKNINLQIKYNVKLKVLRVEVFNSKEVEREECDIVINYLFSNYKEELYKIAFNSEMFNILTNNFIDSDNITPEIFHGSFNELKIKLEQYRIENLIENF